MKTIILPLVALGLAVGLGACALTPAASPDSSALSVSIPYEKHILPNGLTLIIHQDRKAPIVAVNVWYHVGSKDEPPGRSGFAHLFEHLMFNGSENYNDDFFRALEPEGATDFNGTTNNDRTNYFTNVPTPALDRLLWLESDRMGHLLGAIDQAKLDEQRGVVQNEKRQGENQPYGKFWEITARATYPQGHPYSWTTIGSMEDLNAASLEDVKDWFRTYYGAANAVLVVAGDVDPAEVKQKVEHYFGDIAAGPALSRQQQWIAKMSGEKRAVLQDRVPQARLYKVWNTPGYGTLDSTLLDLAADRLGGGKTSLLYERLVYRDQIATDASAFFLNRELGGQFFVVATAKPGGDLRAVEKAVDEVMAEFLKSGPGEEALSRIKTATLAAWLRGAERIGGFGGKSDILAASQVYGGSPDDYQRYLREVQSARATDVREAARRWLSDGVFALDITPLPEYQSAKAGADRSRLPVPAQPPALDLPALERATLANGLELLVARRSAVPVLEMSLLLDGGSAADSAQQPGLAGLTLAMLSEGAAGRTAPQIAERQEALAARISSGLRPDSFALNLSALKATLDDSLALFADVVLRPDFPQSELPRVRQNALAALAQSKVQPLSLARQNLPRLIYGAEHPYARSSNLPAVEQTLKSATPEQMAAFHRGILNPRGARLLVVGDTTLAELQPLIEKHFGQWQAAQTTPAPTFPAVAAQTGARVFLINRTGAEQSTVIAAQLAPPTGNPDEVALQALNTAFGGMFTSRINMNLREDKHWSYGAGSGLGNARAERIFQATANVQTNRTADSMREMLKELRDLAGRRPLKADELAAAQKATVLTLPGDNETSAGVLGSYRHILDYGLPEDYYDTLVGAVQALTPAQVNAAAKKLLQPERLTWVVVGDLAKIEAPVRALKLGTVTVLDAEGRAVR